MRNKSFKPKEYNHHHHHHHAVWGRQHHHLHIYHHHHHPNRKVLMAIGDSPDRKITWWLPLPPLALLKTPTQGGGSRTSPPEGFAPPPLMPPT